MPRCLMVDPEGGWRYGFPKPLPDNIELGKEDMLEWLWSNGYPRGKVPHYIRYFEGDEC